MDASSGFPVHPGHDTVRRTVQTSMESLHEYPRLMPRHDVVAAPLLSSLCTRESSRKSSRESYGGHTDLTIRSAWPPIEVSVNPSLGEKSTDKLELVATMRMSSRDTPQRRRDHTGAT